MKTILAIFLYTLSHAASATEQDAFFANFSKLCGKSFVGKTQFPEKPATPFDQPLMISIEHCSESEIRVPFKVGNDSSRTWVLTKTLNGLQLKHDHRHENGSPHKLTLYGGIANSQGTTMKQSFPADALTHQLVPEGKTNIWTLTIDSEKRTLTYYLERHSKPRYSAVFHLDKNLNETSISR